MSWGLKNYVTYFDFPEAVSHAVFLVFYQPDGISYRSPLRDTTFPSQNNATRCIVFRNYSAATNKNILCIKCLLGPPMIT